MSTPATIPFDAFLQADLRVATVLEARPHPNADKLMLLRVSLGDSERQIVGGIRPNYTPEELVGKQLIIAANLEPRMLRGETSHGMLLAVRDPSSPANDGLALLTTNNPVAPGGKVG